MNFFTYLRSRVSLIIFSICLLGFIGGMVQLDRANRMLPANIGYMLAVAGMMFVGYLCYDYFKAKSYYDKLSELLQEKTGDVVNSLPEPRTIEQSLTNQLLTLLYQEQTTRIEELVRAEREHGEFLLAWVHQTKTPIATGKLILENCRIQPTSTSQNSLTESNIDSLIEEFEEIEDNVQKVLYYSHLNNFANDYIINKVSMKALVKSIVKKHSRSFIYKRLKLELAGQWFEVDTDKKWTGFIIDQIMSNAVKYTNNGGTIKVYMELVSEAQNRAESHLKPSHAHRTGEEILLHIEDTGVGIKAEDLQRVFHRDFTGYNGRNSFNSSGLGLYLGQKLARKLGHYLTISSVSGQGTKVTVHFPKWTDYFEV